MTALGLVVAIEIIAVFVHRCGSMQPRNNIFCKRS
jgi:hypothetical protein